jgi:kumamolisin
VNNPKANTIPGSHREPMHGARYVSPVSEKEEVSVTLVLRRRAGRSLIADASAFSGVRQSREEFASTHGADPSDMEAIEAFAREYGLTVVRRHDPSRRIVLTGPVDAVQRAFSVQLGIYEVPEAGIRYRGRTGTISVPSEIRSAVVAVLGLDNRPIAKPHVRRKKKQASTPGFTPIQLAKLYDFPANLDGTGQTIGIIELGGGYTTDDLTTYFTDLGLTPPSVPWLRAPILPFTSRRTLTRASSMQSRRPLTIRQTILQSFRLVGALLKMPGPSNLGMRWRQPSKTQP